MDWVKLLTEFDGHPKILSVGIAGAGLYARSLAYCGRYETDGHLPREWADQAVAHEGLTELPERLVAAGLWSENESGYEITDFTQINRTHEEMKQIRDKRVSAGQAGGKAKALASARRGAKQKAGKSPSYSSSNSSSSSSGSSNGSVAREFDDWIEHYRETTGNSAVRGSKAARDQFAARRGEYSLDELKLATTGCHGDPFCRENGHDVPETILRASKVQRYVLLGRQRKAEAEPEEAVF